MLEQCQAAGPGLYLSGAMHSHVEKGFVSVLSIRRGNLRTIGLLILDTCLQAPDSPDGIIMLKNIRLHATTRSLGETA